MKRISSLSLQVLTAVCNAAVAVFLLTTGCSCPDESALGPATEDVAPSVDAVADTNDISGDSQDGDSDSADVVTSDAQEDSADSSTGCTDNTECVDRIPVGVCETAQCVEGACLAIPLDDGATCDDGDGCTIDTLCQAGACTGGSLTPCDDANPCTTDSCEDGACVALPDNGAACDDDNPCTEGDQCFAGDCKAGANICTELCGNDIDDDLNGATDCEDFACAGGDECLEVCTVIGTLQCGTTVELNLGEVQGSEKIDFWGCAGQSYPGEEVGYAFVAVQPVTATVTLASAPEGTGLFELSSDATTCDKKFCTESSPTAVSFLATPDAAPTLVLDTPEGAIGQIVVDVQCELCTPDCNGKSCGGDGCGAIGGSAFRA